jgi:hypothetical protein
MVPLVGFAQFSIVGIPVPATQLHKFDKSQDGHRIVGKIEFVATSNTASLAVANVLE